jgi:hypothetical protein
MVESYFVRDRGYGQGDIRIGGFVEMDDSIYSLGFLSQLRDEIINEKFNVITGEFYDGASASSASCPSAQASTVSKSSSSSGGEDADDGAADEEGKEPVEEDAGKEEEAPPPLPEETVKEVDQQIANNAPVMTFEEYMRKKEIEDKKIRLKERRTEEINKQRRLNIAVHVVLTFIF